MNKQWWISAGIRAAKTFAQTMLSFVSIGLAFNEINWVYVLSVSGVAAVYSVLTSLAGLPEVRLTNEVNILRGEVEMLKAEKAKLEVGKDGVDG